MITKPAPICLDETDSTNDYCKRMLETGRPEEFQAVLARFQHGGRGQTGASWISDPGHNLTVSFILFPAFLSPHNSFYLSMCISLAVADTLTGYGIETSIKWPNDIFEGHRKIAGILIENVFEGSRFGWSVAGIGLNVNQQGFPDGIKPATSLSLCTGLKYDLGEVWTKLNENLRHWYGLLRKQAYIRIHDACMRRLYLRNEWHWYATDNGRVEAKITDIMPSGELEVLLRVGSKRLFMFKEIEYPVLK